MNPAALVVWVVVGVLLTAIAIRIVVLLVRVLGGRARRDEESGPAGDDLSPHYRPRS